jgi:hypothetical protein
MLIKHARQLLKRQRQKTRRFLLLQILQRIKMSEYQRIVKLMRHADSLEKFHVYSLMLVKYLKQSGAKHEN